MCSELPQVRGVCCLCVTLHCLYACRRFNLARLHLACISPGYATGSMQPSRPSPLSPHLLNRRGAQSARPPRSAPSVPPSLRVTCATAAAPTPHRTPRRCCGPAAPPSRGCCTTPRCAATPSPLRRRRLVVVLPLRRRRLAVELPLCRRRLAVELPLRRRRLAVELRCVAVASPSRCCGAVTLPPSCRGCAAAFPACASPVTLPTTLRRRAERSLD